MQEKINASLLKTEKIKSKDKPFEINDTELKGFTLRIQPEWKDKFDNIHEGTKTYLFRYRASDGKQNRIVIGRHTDFTPTQAREKADALRRRWKDGINLKPAKQAEGADQQAEQKIYTLQSFFDEKFKPWVEAHHKASKATLTHFVQFSNMAGKPLTEYTNVMFEDWKVARLNAKIKPPTINRNLSMIRSLFSKAVEWDVLDNHPLSKVKSLKVDPIPKTRYLSDEEQDRMMKALDGREEEIRLSRDRYNLYRSERGYPLYPELRTMPFADRLKPMIILSLNTGIRWGELTSLNWADVDIPKSILTVQGLKAKSGKTRYIPLNSIAVDILKQWQKQQASYPLVFPGKEGKQIDNLDKSWAKVLKAAKISDFRWHDLRHSFASHLVMAGVDLNTVRELMGHSDIKMTLRYAHLAPEHKAAAVAFLVKP